MLRLTIITERSQSLSKTIIAVWMLLSSIHTAFSQVNLVPNPSFENLKRCPNSGGEIDSVISWGTLKDGGGSTPDLFSVCCTHQPYCGVPYQSATGGFQYPHSGNNYVGVAVAYSLKPNIFREYIQSKLQQKLNAGKTYCVSFFCSLSNMQYAYIKTLGAYLDSGNISAAQPYGLAAVNPQVYSQQPLTDTINWIKIEGSFVATGIEDYISLGNFFPDSTSGIGYLVSPPPATWSSYYDIDDVSVIDVSTPAYSGHDTSIVLGDSVFIGRQPEVGLNEDCIWFINNNPIDTIAGMWVTPTATTTYVLQQTICGTTNYDTVKVTVNPNGVNNFTYNEQMKIYPNPTTGDIWIKAQNETSDQSHVIIYDLVGEKVYEKTMVIKDAVKIIPDLPSGTYLISIKATNANFKPYNGKITVIK